ncbi:alpha-2Db adrenergic receptor-like [Glandiceps talaboti]
MDISNVANSTDHTTLATLQWQDLTEDTRTMLKLPTTIQTVNSSLVLDPTDYWFPNLTNVTNGTDVEEDVYRLPYSNGVMIFLLLLTSVITSVSIIGNTLILLAFFTTPRLRRLTNYFYASLAISDLAAGILVMPFMASFTTNAYWKFGKPFCIVWLCIDMFVYSTSVYHMCVICLDRFLNVKYPFWYRVRRTRKVILSFIFVAWCLGLLTEVPATIFYEHIRGESIVDYTLECDVEWMDNAAITVISFVVTVIIPFLFVLILYGQIFFIIKNRRNLTATNTTSTRKKSEVDEEKSNEQTAKRGCCCCCCLKFRNKKSQPADVQMVKQTEKRQSETLFALIKQFCLPGRRKSYSFTESAVGDTENEREPNVTPIRYERKSESKFDFSCVNESFELDETIKSDRKHQTYRNNISAALYSVHNQKPCIDMGNKMESQHKNEKKSIVEESDIDVISSESADDVPQECDDHLQELPAVTETLKTSTMIKPSSSRVSIQNCVGSTVTRSPATANIKRKDTKRGSLSAQRSGERKAATTLGILLGVFLLTWLPWKLTTIADSIAGDYLFPDLWYDLAIWLQYSNSMINPFLYVLRENEFKVAIKRIICRVFCCKKVEDNRRRTTTSTVIIREPNISASSR